MTFKFALIAALCLAQGFALKPLGKPFDGKGPCKHPLSESAEEIPHEFEEAMQEMDEVRETVSMAAMDAYLKGNDPKVIIACFNEQRGNYAKLGHEIAEKMRKAAQDLREDLGSDFEKWAQRAEEPIRNIAVTMKTLPHKMWEHIKNHEFSKALEVMRESRRIVNENSKILSKIIDEMAEEFPEAAKKAEKVAHEIHETAKNGCKAIGEAFHKCVEQGGPKNPVDDAEIEDQWAESQEH